MRFPASSLISYSIVLVAPLADAKKCTTRRLTYLNDNSGYATESSAASYPVVSLTLTETLSPTPSFSFTFTSTDTSDLEPTFTSTGTSDFEPTFTSLSSSSSSLTFNPTLDSTSSTTHLLSTDTIITPSSSSLISPTLTSTSSSSSTFSVNPTLESTSSSSSSSTFSVNPTLDSTSTSTTTTTSTSSTSSTSSSSSDTALLPTLTTISPSSSSTSFTTEISSTTISLPSTTITSVTSSTSTITPTTISTLPPGAVVTDQAYIDTVIRHHNVHRSNHSAVALTWSPALAEIAQVIASSCIYGHNVTAGGGGYGQNIGAGFLSTAMGQFITEGLYNSEVNNYIYFGMEPDLNTLSLWGHFTQIVWKSSLTVGCYTSDCSATGLQNAAGIPPYFTVCNYAPPGNFVGQFTPNVGPGLGAPSIDASYGCPSAANCVDQ